MNSLDARRVLPSNWRKLTGLPPDIPLGQPFLRVYLNANQSFTSATTALVGFDTVDADTKGWWDATNKRYTPQLAGRYQMSGSLGIIFGGAISAGGYVLEVQLRKNGTAGYKLPQITGVALASTEKRTVAGTFEYQMNGTTDYMDMAGYSEGTSPSFSGSGAELCMMQIRYIGP